MLILGLNSAHDAGVALVDDGKILGLIQRERIARVKRSALLSAEFIEQSLQYFGVAWSDIDVVAMCTSQAWPIMFVDRTQFSVALDPSLRVPGRAELDDHAAVQRAFEAMKRRDDLYPESISVDYFKKYFRDGAGNGEYFVERASDIVGNVDGFLPAMEWPDFPSDWLTADPVERLRRGFSRVQTQKLGSYLPARFTLRGQSRPGLLLPHHLAHAASAYYQSDFSNAVVHTLDNGDVLTPHRGYVGGMLMLGNGNRLYPLAPNFGYHGHFYQRVGEMLGLGHGGAAGKLMGLAPYGEPRFFDHSMIGDSFKIFGESYSLGYKGLRNQVLSGLNQNMEYLGKLSIQRFAGSSPYRRDGELGARDLGRPGIDLAATAQTLYEQCSIWMLSTFLRTIYQHVANRQAALCLGGGGALNCPTNTALWRTLPVSDIFVPPACDDSGLPIGAALAVCHDYLDRPRVAQDAGRCASAYLGREYDDARIRRAVAQVPDRIVVEELPDTAADAASTIASGEIVAWFEGRSEVGPRALGHRSILADARGSDVWTRVNALKKREYWRPFAPAVLVEDQADWFRDSPSVSPHMLFTATVRGDGLPAITHVDRSARVQTVDESCGGFHELICHFKRQTGVPVVLNTSFNGPGEPIIETPEEAVRFVETSELNALYIGKYKVSRR